MAHELLETTSLRDREVKGDPLAYHRALTGSIREIVGETIDSRAGIHHCSGANLAREELVQTFDMLLARARGFEVVPGKNDHRHHPPLILRGLERLHIRFEPRRGNHATGR